MSEPSFVSRAQRRRGERDIRKAIEAARRRPDDPHYQARCLLDGSSGQWQMLLSVHTHDEGAEHWSCSMMLWPAGRSSVEEDWKLLGYWLAMTITATGSEGDPRVLSHLEYDDPNLPIHYYWHKDGKECGEAPMMREVLRATRKATIPGGRR